METMKHSSRAAVTCCWASPGPLRAGARARARADRRRAQARSRRRLPRCPHRRDLRGLVKDRMVMTDESRARIGFLPASTFKIPHALIALETGVVADVDKEVIRWDGVPREIEEWNRDHTLRSAMRLFGGAGVPADRQPHRLGAHEAIRGRVRLRQSRYRRRAARQILAGRTSAHLARWSRSSFCGGSIATNCRSRSATSNWSRISCRRKRPTISTSTPRPERNSRTASPRSAGWSAGRSGRRGDHLCDEYRHPFRGASRAALGDVARDLQADLGARATVSDG